MGPGIYYISFFPEGQMWSMLPNNNDECFELNKVHHTEWDADLFTTERYFVYLDSTGHIPAYVRGANMIEEAMRGHNQ